MTRPIAGGAPPGLAAACAWLDADDAAAHALLPGGWTASKRGRAVLATARAIRHLERAQRHMMLADAEKEGPHD